MAWAGSLGAAQRSSVQLSAAQHGSMRQFSAAQCAYAGQETAAGSILAAAGRPLAPPSPTLLCCAGEGSGSTTICEPAMRRRRLVGVPLPVFELGAASYAFGMGIPIPSTLLFSPSGVQRVM